MKRSALTALVLIMSSAVHAAPESKSAGVSRRGVLFSGAAAAVAPNVPLPSAPPVATAPAIPVVDLGLAEMLANGRTDRFTDAVFSHLSGGRPDIHAPRRFADSPYLNMREGSLEVIKDWAEKFPESAAPVRELIDQYTSVVENSSVAGFGSYAESHSQFTEKVLPRITQWPWSTLDWRQIFPARLIGAEMELAHELGVSLSQVHASVQLLMLQRGSDFIGHVADFMGDNAFTIDSSQLIVSQKFTDAYLAKVEKISLSYANHVRKLQTPLVRRDFPLRADRWEHGLGLEHPSPAWSRSFRNSFSGYSMDILADMDQALAEITRFYPMALERVAKTKELFLLLTAENPQPDQVARFDDLTRTLTEELRTLPQRVHLQIEFSRTGKFSKDGIPPADSPMWQEFGFANAVERIEKTRAWSRRLHSMGIAIAAASEKLPTDAPNEDEDCQALLLTQSVTTPTEPKKEKVFQSRWQDQEQDKDQDQEMGR